MRVSGGEPRKVEAGLSIKDQLSQQSTDERSKLEPVSRETVTVNNVAIFRLSIYDEIRIRCHIIETYLAFYNLSIGQVGDEFTARGPRLFNLLPVNQSTSGLRVDGVNQLLVRNLDSIDACSRKAVVVICKEDRARSRPEPLDVLKGF